MKYRLRKGYFHILKFWRQTWFGWAITFIIIVWGCTFVFIKIWKAPNEIGDSFGMVNALFSGLAFAFLIYTSWMQRKELELQRRELKLTRKEMAQTTKVHKKQVDLFQLQIYNERAQMVAEFKPRLKIQVTKEIDSEIRIKILTCVKSFILDNFILCDGINISRIEHNEHYESKSRNIVLSLPNKVIIKDDTLYQIIVNYTDDKGHKYNQLIRFGLFNSIFGQLSEVEEFVCHRHFIKVNGEIKDELIPDFNNLSLEFQ